MEQQKEWGKRLLQLAVTLACLLATSASQAAPPFVTDDPEPVDYRAGEFYLSSQYASTRDGKSGTAPHLEVNYGIAPETQAHILLPLAFNRPSGGPTTFGIGDLEAGVKYRFLHETETSPQVGIFPLVHIPTGESRRGLGTGHVPVLLPIWAQKSWEPYTT